MSGVAHCDGAVEGVVRKALRKGREPARGVAMRRIKDASKGEREESPEKRRRQKGGSKVGRKGESPEKRQRQTGGGKAGSKGESPEKRQGFGREDKREG